MFHNVNGVANSLAPPMTCGGRNEASSYVRRHQNTSIQNALVDLLGKPIADSNALCIPAATHANPGGAAQAWNFIAARQQLA